MGDGGGADLPGWALRPTCDEQFQIEGDARLDSVHVSAGARLREALVFISAKVGCGASLLYMHPRFFSSSALW